MICSSTFTNYKINQVFFFQSSFKKSFTKLVILVNRYGTWFAVVISSQRLFAKAYSNMKWILMPEFLYFRVYTHQLVLFESDIFILSTVDIWIRYFHLSTVDIPFFILKTSSVPNLKDTLFIEVNIITNLWQYEILFIKYYLCMSIYMQSLERWHY